MLTQFKVESHFNKLHVTLYVECGTRKEAGLSVTYDRIFYGDHDVPFHQVRTPEMAEAWLRRSMGERGNFVESLEWQCRTGVYQRPAAA